MEITLTINGKKESIAENSSIMDVMTAKGFKKGIAVAELNEKIISDDNWETTILHDGDIMEIVSFVGGGC